MRAGWFLGMLVGSLVLGGCDDSGDEAAQLEDDAGADAGAPDMGMDRATLEDGTWRMSVSFAALALSFDFEVDVANEADGVALTIRAVNGAGVISDDLATVSGLVPDDDGRFRATFEAFLLPAAFSPVGDVTVTVFIEAEVRDAEFFCGLAGGEAIDLMLDLGQGTFAAVPKGSGEPPSSCDGEAPVDDTPTIDDARPARVYLPADYDGSEEAWPMVVLLHGFGSAGVQQDTYLGVSARRDEFGFILVLPEGTTNPDGEQFWNATPACCDDFDAEVDDVAYLTGLLDQAQAQYRVDPARVYLMGHSNGGFMSYRLACELGDRIAGVAVLAGSTVADEVDCANGAPTSVLHVHARDDGTVPYTGRPGPEGYPSAPDTAQRWATRAGCGVQSEGERLDLVASVPGDETAVTTWNGCGDTAVELWSLDEGGHIPAFGDRWGPAVLPWLLAQ